MSAIGEVEDEVGEGGRRRMEGGGWRAEDGEVAERRLARADRGI